MVLFVTVGVCTVFLTVASSFTKAADNIGHTYFVLAMPRAPAPLGLAPEPETASMAPEADPTEDLLLAEISAPPDLPPPRAKIPFHGIIVAAAGRYDVDPNLIRAIILAESGYNPRAKSKKGARGLMQLMPSTARALGVRDIFDPAENIDGGVRYFRSLLDRFDGDVQLALAAYNAGSRHVRNYEGVPPFKATQLYIKKVLHFHKKFSREDAAATPRLA